MKGASYLPEGRGPFRAEQIRPGDPYELSDGHAIVSEPSGRRHGRRHLVGGALLVTDPAVEDAGVEVGHVLDPWTLRAPDVSVGAVGDEPGFAHAAPALAVEYVEAGANERDLERKIAQLLGAGAAFVWVVRLAGERRVEVHRADGRSDVKHAGESVEAPGVLRNPVPVEALYDRSAAHALMLRNLLQRAGYADLDAVRAEGEARGEERGEARGEARGTSQGEARGRVAHARAMLERIVTRRGDALDAGQRAVLAACDDLAVLDGWIDEILAGASARDVVRPR